MPSIRNAQVVRCPPRWLLLRVETTDGEVGWGEAIGDLHDEVEPALEAACNKIVGVDVNQIEKIRQELLYGRFWRDGPVLNTVAAAVEMALWDLLGKSMGAPVHELLGRSVNAYSSIETYGVLMLGNLQIPLRLQLKRVSLQ